MQVTQLLFLNDLMLGLVTALLWRQDAMAETAPKRKRSVGLYGARLFGGRAKAWWQEHPRAHILIWK